MSQTATGRRLEVCGLWINPSAVVDPKLVLVSADICGCLTKVTLRMGIIRACTPVRVVDIFGSRYISFITVNQCECIVSG